MLSDDELQAIADRAIGSARDGFLALRQCKLLDPPGLYFEFHHRSAQVSTPRDRLEPVGLVPGGGVFVDRRTGESRGVSAVGLAQAAAELKHIHGYCELPKDLGKVLKHVLGQASTEW